MCVLPLRCLQHHYFLESDGDLWLFDTGSRSSFGSRAALNLAGHAFTIDGQLGELTPQLLERDVGVACVGLLGRDVWSHFDLLLDPRTSAATLSTAELAADGESVDLEEFLGLPIVPVTVGGASHRFFFDTGAQLSYFQDRALTDFPYAGRAPDFYPGFRSFETETYHVALTLGSARFGLRCGALPDELRATLMQAGTTGIVGNEILENRTVLFAPRRRLLVLGQ